MLYELSDASSAIQEVHLVFTKHSEKALQLAPIIAMLEELDIKPDDPLGAA